MVADLVERFSRDRKVFQSPDYKEEQLRAGLFGLMARRSSSLASGATLGGAGAYVSNDTSVTITNDGVVSVSTVQLNGGASPKYLTGSGTWNSCNLTIAAACSLELGSSHTFNSCSTCLGFVALTRRVASRLMAYSIRS